MSGISSSSGVSQGNAGAIPQTSFSAGTAYSLTNAAAAVVFGTTSPSVTIPEPGTYLVLARAQTRFNAATFSASRTINVKMRRTNNTATDLANGAATGITGIVTTLVGGCVDMSWWTIYTTNNSSDTITLFSSLTAAPEAGSLDLVEASIIAMRLQ